MTAFIADVSDPLLGWASTTELDLSRQLSEATFVVQISMTGDELERLDRFWGLFLTRQLTAGAEFSALLDACPALFAVTLVGRAGRLADLSHFEEEYWAGLGVPAEVVADHTGVITSRLRDILVAAGVDPLDIDGPDGELGRLLLHALIPAGWLPDVLAVLDANPEFTGADVTAHYLEHSPTRQVGPLCQVLPDKATELFDAIISFYRWAGTAEVHEWASWNGTHGHPIPQLIMEDLIEELRERPAGTEDRLSTVGAAAWEATPRLVYDVPRERVVLRLPQMHLSEDVTELRWHVAIDGEVAEYRLGMDHDTEGFSEYLDVPVRNAAREIVVTELVRRISFVVPVVTEPCLLFTMRGQDITRKKSLHHADVIVVAPEDAEIRDRVRDTPLPTDEGIALRGWNGWVARTLDLSEAVSFEVVRPTERGAGASGGANSNSAANSSGMSAMASGFAGGFSGGNEQRSEVRSVDPRQRVIFIEEEPVDSVRSISGLQVHARSLQAEFPPTVSGLAETWYLSVSSYAGPGEVGIEVTPQEPLEVPAEGGVFDVFDPELYESPWVGEYMVRLRGPRNESFRHRYAIVEGLSTSIDHRGFRIPAAGGLTPVTVRLRTEKASTISPEPLQIEASQDRGSVVVSTEEGDSLPLNVTPPRLRFQVPLKGEGARWRSTPLVCAGSELDPTMFLRVRTGGHIEKPVITARDHHGQPVRTKKMITWDGITWRVPLKDLAAPLAVMTGGHIELSWIDEATHHTTSVRLVTLAPTPQWQIALEGIDGASDAEETTAELVISAENDSRDATTVIRHRGAPDGRPLGVWVWPTTAPWRRALSLRVHEGRVALPAEMVGIGPLAVQVYCADLAEDLRAPARPGPQAQRIAQPGFATGQGLDSLSALLAGETSSVDGDADMFTLLWDLHAGWLEGAAGAAQSVDVLVEACRSHPTEALAGLAQSLVGARRRPGLVISSGLVRRAFGPEVADEASVPWMAALGLLAEAAGIPRAEVPAGAGAGAASGAASGAAGALVDGEGADADATDAELAALASAAVMTDSGSATDADGEPAAAAGTEASLQEILAEESSPAEARSRAVVLEKLAATVGQRAVEALTTGRDQSLDNACLDRNTVHIAHMPVAQQKVILQQFLDSAGIVPGPMSEDNSRLLAVLETFKWRAELTALLGDPELMVTAAKLLKRVRSANRQLYAAARVRFDRLEGVDTEKPENRWALAPIVSLVFALAARVEAHGAGSMGDLSASALAGWARIADLLPDLVAGDLVSADAMVLGTLGHKTKA